MKFIVDAQLPRRLAICLAEAGHDAIHTLDLPDANRTRDAEIIRIAAEQQRVVVTKDSDFVDSHILLGEPAKLLLISTGNSSNSALEALIVPNLASIVSALATHDLIELSRTVLILHA